MDKFVLQKQIELQKNIAKSVSPAAAVGNKGFPVGTVRYWNGYRYKKKIDGSWAYSPDNKNSNKEIEEKEQREGKELTASEADVLHAYTNRKYKDINAALRSQEDINDIGIKRDIKSLKSALDKMPEMVDTKVYRGIVPKVWNGAAADSMSIEKVYNHYKNLEKESGNLEDNILEFDAFLSTSKNKGVIEEFIGNQKDGRAKVMFEIHTKDEHTKARDISEASVIPAEEEVLFKSESEFEVQDVFYNEEDQIIEVELREI